MKLPVLTRCLAFGLLGMILVLAFPSLHLRAVAITFDGSVTNQLIDGFGVNANHRSWNNDELKPVLDAFIDQAGMTLFRVVYDQTDWEATNDNSDASVMNWNYYNSVYTSAEFTRLWNMLNYLNGRGVSNGVVLSLMGPGPSWLGGVSLNPGMEDEWAEMLASMLVYARNNAGVGIKLIGPDNEPDISNEGIHMGSATQYTNALHKLALKLDANGLGDIQFVAPDLAGGGPTYMPEMVADPLIMSRLAHFGVHSYSGAGGGSSGIFSYLQSTPYRDRTFWMTEFNVWCSTCDSGTRGTYDWSYCKGTADYLLNHLLNNASGGIVWEGYDSFYTHPPSAWSFWGLFAINDTNAAVKTYTPRKHFYTLSQITKWVRPGARRIGVSGSSSPFSPLLGFNHTALGQFTIVGINAASSSANLTGSLLSLPAMAWLDLYYTSASTNLAHLGHVSVSNGNFVATIPADCVFTLTGSSGPTASITNPPDGAQFNAPATIPIYAEAASVTGRVDRIEFYNGSLKLGEATDVPYTFTWTNVPMGDYPITARSVDAFGNVGSSAAVRVSVAGPVSSISTAPATALLDVGASRQFLATCHDLLGHTLNPQPEISWSINRGGTINSNGIFSADRFAGGPFKIVAANSGICGTSLVTTVPLVGFTLGNTNEGTLTDNLWNGGAWINAIRVQAATRMTAATIRAKVTAIPGNYKCAVYSDSGGLPMSLLGTTAETAKPADGWQTFAFTSPLVLTNNQYYWLAIWSNDSAARVYYTGDGPSLRWARRDYGLWPNPISTSGGDSFNYCIAAQTATAPVPPVNWPTPAPITYGATLSPTQLNAACPVPGSFTYDPPVGLRLNAGLGQELSLTFLPQDTNTWLGIITNQVLDVFPEALVVTAQNTNKIFGAPLPEFSVSYSGFINGETPANLDVPPKVSTDALSSSDAGTYSLTPAGAVARNYEMHYLPGTLTITPASTVGFLESSANPAALARPVSFTYTLSTVPPGAGTPAGQVFFIFDATNSSPAIPLFAGTTKYITSTLGPGRHPVRAEFSGSLNFLGSTNSLVPEQLVLPQPTISIALPTADFIVLQAQGLAQETYRFQSTMTLDPSSWVTLGSSSADESGIVRFTNSRSSGLAAEFYRCVYP